MSEAEKDTREARVSQGGEGRIARACTYEAFGGRCNRSIGHSGEHRLGIEARVRELESALATERDGAFRLQADLERSRAALTAALEERDEECKRANRLAHELGRVDRKDKFALELQVANEKHLREVERERAEAALAGTLDLMERFRNDELDPYERDEALLDVICAFLRKHGRLTEPS